MVVKNGFCKEHRKALIIVAVTVGCVLVGVVVLAVVLPFTVFRGRSVLDPQAVLTASTTQVQAAHDSVSPGATVCRDSLQTAHKLPNINYAGLGYNVILGNPHQNLDDPGFTLPVLQLDYSAGAMTSDCRWLVPDKVDVRQAVSCSQSLDAGEIRGSQSYQTTLSVDAEVSVDVAHRYRFTASGGFKEVSEGSSNQHRSYVSTVARCIIYRAEINHKYASFGVTRQFSDAVRSLPTSRNDDVYFRFIAAYGTHFTTSLHMGAKAVMRSEFESSSWTKLEMNGFNFKLGAEATFPMGSAGGSISTDYTRQTRETFEQARRSVKRSYLGSQPPADGRWETWAEASGMTPYPIQYKLEPLTSLLNVRYFPDVDYQVLLAKKNHLLAMLEVYCDSTPNCGIPQADRTPIRIAAVASSIVSKQKMSCPPGLSALSCGIENSNGADLSRKRDFGRYAMPTGDGRCECRDDQAAVCTAWCSNAARNLSVLTAIGQRGEFSVACPPGFKVLGCHAEPDTDREAWRANFPRDDGNACTCYDFYGVRCHATCASNVRNHEVRSEYGTGHVTVTCSSNNYVLGCGMKPRKVRTGEYWRTQGVATSNSCRCYDSEGATCYALCGQFV